MSCKKLKLGDPVWAKMRGYPNWPGYVSDAPEGMKPQPKKKTFFHCVFFFGTKNFGWVEESNIRPYVKPKRPPSMYGKSAGLRQACEEIDEYIKDNANDVDNLQVEGNCSTADPTSSCDAMSSTSEPPAKKRKVTATENSPKTNSIQTPVLSGKSSSTLALLKPATVVVSRPTNLPQLAKIASSSGKHIRFADMKIGFIGLGTMGKGIVRHLLHAGHNVVVWNRSREKVYELVRMGATAASTPCDLASTCDITFSCLVGPQEAKAIFFGNFGVQKGLSRGKGFVEMTSIDPETSTSLAQGASSMGATYLEAQIQGSKDEVEVGSLVVLTAGDMSLYHRCRSCLEAMSKRHFYLGSVGSACKLNLVLQLVHGIALAGLAEGMALADRAGLSLSDILEVLTLTSMDSQMVRKKGSLIIDGSFATQQPLQHLQKDLKLALNMAHGFEQCLPISAICNEMFKHAKRLGYGDHDSSAVYIRARF